MARLTANYRGYYLELHEKLPGLGRNPVSTAWIVVIAGMAAVKGASLDGISRFASLEVIADMRARGPGGNVITGREGAAVFGGMFDGDPF